MFRNMSFCFCADSIKGTLQKGTEFSFFVSTQGIPPTHPPLSPSPLGLYLPPIHPSLTPPFLVCVYPYPPTVQPIRNGDERKREEGRGGMREDASGGRRRDEVHGSTKQSRVRGGEGLRMRCTNTWRHDKISTHNKKTLGEIEYRYNPPGRMSRTSLWEGIQDAYYPASFWTSNLFWGFMLRKPHSHHFQDSQIFGRDHCYPNLDQSF